MLDSIGCRTFIFAEVIVVNWGELPDLGAVGLLTGAFASVARRKHTHVSSTWLTGWAMIAIHFGAFLFLTEPSPWGPLAIAIGLCALTWAGLLFMWAAVPYREERSSRLILASLLFSNTLYLSVSVFAPDSHWPLNLCAPLFGMLPLIVTLSTVRKFDSPLRWAVVGLYCALSIFLMSVQHHPGDGQGLAEDAVLFTVYFGCCIHFWYAYRRATAGAFITIAGFLAWAMVFVVAPTMQELLPKVPVEAEVWNLPKFLVAIGMILLLLEDQIEHNQYLALHDHLTGLPNRRLYQDRLARALERANRSQAKAALLVIDLDRFKEVNDTLGHHVGDLVLQRVGEMFSSRMRRTDTVARTGGDEFSVILEEPTSRLDALLVGRSLMQLLKDPLELGEHTVQVGASVGIAIYPEDAQEMDALCIAADLRMYDAKNDTRESREQMIARTARALTIMEHTGRAGLQVLDQ
jgi:diguanylate cyclase (GGDEF)-like protein